MKPGLLLIGPKATYDVLRYDEKEKLLTLIRHGVKPGRRMRNGRIKGAFTTKFDSERLKLTGYTLQRTTE